MSIVSLDGYFETSTRRSARCPATSPRAIGLAPLEFLHPTTSPGGRRVVRLLRRRPGRRDRRVALPAPGRQRASGPCAPRRWSVRATVLATSSPRPSTSRTDARPRTPCGPARSASGRWPPRHRSASGGPAWTATCATPTNASARSPAAPPASWTAWAGWSACPTTSRRTTSPACATRSSRPAPTAASSPSPPPRALRRVARPCGLMRNAEGEPRSGGRHAGGHHRAGPKPGRAGRARAGAAPADRALQRLPGPPGPHARVPLRLTGLPLADRLPPSGAGRDLDVRALVLDEDLPAPAQGGPELQHRDTVTVVCRVRRKDGSVGWFESTLAPVRDEVGRVAEVVCVSRDVTERKSAELQLAHQAPARRAHRAAEPRPVPRPPRPRAAPSARAAHRRAGGPVPRPRPLQGGQRLARPRRRRPAADRRRRTRLAAAPAPGRHRRAPRRRRVHRPARGHRRRARGARRSPSALVDAVRRAVRARRAEAFLSASDRRSRSRGERAADAPRS